MAHYPVSSVFRVLVTPVPSEASLARLLEHTRASAMSDEATLNHIWASCSGVAIDQNTSGTVDRQARHFALLLLVHSDVRKYRQAHVQLQDVWGHAERCREAAYPMTGWGLEMDDLDPEKDPLLRSYLKEFQRTPEWEEKTKKTSNPDSANPDSANPGEVLTNIGRRIPTLRELLWLRDFAEEENWNATQVVNGIWDKSAFDVEDDDCLLYCSGGNPSMVFCQAAWDHFEKAKLTFGNAVVQYQLHHALKKVWI